MRSINTFDDQGFAVIFATIILLAAVPQFYSFWQKIVRYQTDGMLKMELLKMGFTADEIIQRVLIRHDSEPRSQRA